VNGLFLFCWCAPPGAPKQKGNAYRVPSLLDRAAGVYVRLAAAFTRGVVYLAPPVVPPGVVVAPPPAGGVGAGVGVDEDGAEVEGALEPAGALLSLPLLQAVSATANTEARISVLLIIRYLLAMAIYATRRTCPRGFPG
jgi:hypothetical protein